MVSGNRNYGDIQSAWFCDFPSGESTGRVDTCTEYVGIDALFPQHGCPTQGTRFGTDFPTLRHPLFLETRRDVSAAMTSGEWLNCFNENHGYECSTHTQYYTRRPWDVHIPCCCRIWCRNPRHWWIGNPGSLFDGNMSETDWRFYLHVPKFFF